jgi:hypothetical protein
MEFSTLNTGLKIFLSRNVTGAEGEDLVEKQSAEQGLMPVLEDEEEEGREMGVSRLELVELIEGEVSKLSPRGRDLWERLELHVETEAPEKATPATLPPPSRWR